MKLSKQLKTKLDLIRLEGLCRLILNNYKEKDIISKITSVTGSEPRDVKAIYKLSRSSLIKIIENSNIDSKSIEEYYEEYRYGLKPGFSIYSFKSNVRLSNSKVQEKIKEELKKLNCGENEQPAVKNLKFNNMEVFEENKLCEYSFFYSKKYSYIDENEEPTYIYELKETFVWISMEHKFVAIKNCDEKISKIISKIISNIYNTELNHIILTQELINKIFGDKRKKVAGVNPNAGENEAEKIIISDSNLDKKEELKKQLEPYTTTSENLEIVISEKSNTLGVNNSKGKLHLTKNMTATIFRNWSVTTIRKIIEFISKNETNFEIFKARNIMSNQYWDEFSKDVKCLIEEIIFKILTYIEDKENYTPNMNSKINYSKIINNGFYTKIFINCITCNDSFVIPKCNCGSYDIRINNKQKVFCGKCGEVLNSLECEDGHDINIENLQNINIFCIPEQILYDKIIKFIKNEFNIVFKGYISISNSCIYIKEDKFGELISINEIAEFNEVSKIIIDKQDTERINERLKSIKENCLISSKEFCNVCNRNINECCILQLFTTYNGYRAGPHHGHEFGDINFKVTLREKKYEFVGVVKSYCNLTHASKAGREMIQQILSSTQDKRIELIGAICPARFDTQLEKDLEYIAKCTRSKIVILDDQFMIKQLKHYENKCLKKM